MRRSNKRAMTVASATSAVLFIIAAVAVVCARRGTRTALYGVGSEDWWSNQNFDSYDDQMSRGGRQSWEGHADTFWNGEVASDGMGSPEEGTGTNSAWTPPREPSRLSGHIDISDVGEGAERVRLGLEGEWSGIQSSSRPGVDQEGAGAGWYRPSAGGAAGLGGFGEAGEVTSFGRHLTPMDYSGQTTKGVGAVTEQAYPLTSSYAYERTPDRWVSKETPPSVWPASEEQISEINSGEYPGGLVQGTFPGVNPNDPDGTSWMIGMHKDGEETVGRWAQATRRSSLAHKQQLALVTAGVLARPKLPLPHLSTSTSSSSSSSERRRLTVLRKGRGRLEVLYGGSYVDPEHLYEGSGADITAVGEDNRDQHVAGAWGNRPDPTSWIIGEHRRPHWSDSQTFACSTTSLCKKGQADVHHSFQADTNPYVDKRRVFDPEAQLDASDRNHGTKAYPWDPTLDPQIWRSANPHCGDGKLREACWQRGARGMEAASPAERPKGGAPPIAVDATIRDMQCAAIAAAAPVAKRWSSKGVRLLRGAQGYRLNGHSGLIDDPIRADEPTENTKGRLFGRDGSGGDVDQQAYPIAHWKTPLKALGDREPFMHDDAAIGDKAPLGDYSNWPYSAQEAHESWPLWADSRRPKRLDAAVSPAAFGAWGLGSAAKVLNSGHTGGAPHDSAGDKNRQLPDIYSVSDIGLGAMADKASVSSTRYMQPAGASRFGGLKLLVYVAVRHTDNSRTFSPEWEVWR